MSKPSCRNVFPPKPFKSQNADEQHFSLTHFNFFGVIQTQNVLPYFHRYRNTFPSDIVFFHLSLTFVSVELGMASDTKLEVIFTGICNSIKYTNTNLYVFVSSNVSYFLLCFLGQPPCFVCILTLTHNVELLHTHAHTHIILQ